MYSFQNKKFIFIPLFFGLFIHSPSFGMHFNGVINGGYEFGGDRLCEVRYTDGTSSEIHAGSGFLFSGGLALKNLMTLGPLMVDAQFTTGFKLSGIKKATNVTGDFWRFPFEALLLGKMNIFRLGLGPTYHLFNALYGTGLLRSVQFCSAFGLVIQGEVLLNHEKYALGARYIKIQYKTKKNRITMDGSSFGVYCSLFF